MMDDERDRQAQLRSSHPGQRDAPRIALMMRAAKLLCESGEYICIVRDISATGTKIRLFHELPPDSHLFLELANGERYAMERIWQRDGEAGFRFASAIDVNEFMEEGSAYPRRPLRLQLRRPAIVVMNKAISQALLLNFSQQGACIETGNKLPAHRKLRLDMDGLPPRVGHVCWRRDHNHGLVFQQAFRLDEFARYAFDMQPYSGTSGTAAQAAHEVRQA